MGKNKILFVDDEKDILSSLEKIFADDNDLELFFANNAEKGLDILNKVKIDLIISDHSMPKMSGIELFKITKNKYPDTLRILLTGYSDLKNAIIAINEGEIYRYITKPWDILELKGAINTALDYIKLKNENENMVKEIELYNLELEEKVAIRTKEIKDVQEVAIFSLARLSESRDPETGEHLIRIREYCKLISLLLINNNLYKDIIDNNFIENIYQSSPLHDIGKVGIPDHILLKPGKLSPEEFEIMKQHTIIGGKTLEDAEKKIKNIYEKESFLTMGKIIAYHHHEKWDGSGYPYGLRDNKIPLCARITCISDVYDALTSKRPYKEAFSHEKALEIIKSENEKQFDPAIVDVFINMNNEFKKISQKYKDSIIF